MSDQSQTQLNVASHPNFQSIVGSVLGQSAPSIWPQNLPKIVDQPPPKESVRMTEGKASFEEIQLVQTLIERCLQYYMTQFEVVAALFTQAHIEPGFTHFVWEKLDEQNPDFFKAYYTRLRVKEQIREFNQTVSQQAHIISKLYGTSSSPEGVPQQNQVQHNLISPYTPNKNYLQTPHGMGESISILTPSGSSGAFANQSVSFTPAAMSPLSASSFQPEQFIISPKKEETFNTSHFFGDSADSPN